MARLELDILSSAGVAYGKGPMRSVSRWQYTARLNRAGSIAFEFDGTDDAAPFATNRRYARAKLHLDGEWVEVGYGRIDNSGMSPQAGRVSRRASGLDLIGELRDRRVGNLAIAASGSSVPIADALADIQALAPAGWTIAVDPDDTAAMASVEVYARFAGESVLGALVMIAEHTQSYFYRGEGRTLYFRRTWEDSGIRAVQAHGHLGPGQCAITRLEQTVDTHDLLTRLHPFGSGNGRTRLTLRATNRTAPTGYTLNKTLNYIERDAAVTDYGQIDFPEIEFKEIGPISNTNADLQAAANVLFDSALAELQRRSTLADQHTYTLTVTGCNAMLRAGQTIRLIYYDPSRNIDVDEDLYILEATWEASGGNVRTVGLVVSTDTRWPESDQSAAAERASQGRVYMAHPQIGPNAYWENATLIVGSDQEDHRAEFAFRLGDEVVQVQQVLLWFKLEPVISFTSTSSATSTTSGASSITASLGGSAHSHTVTLTDHDHDIPDHDHITNIVNDPTPDRNLGFDIFGSFGILVYDGADAGTIELHTTFDVDNDIATTRGGGGATETSNTEDEHTHNIEHDHDVTPSIVTSYGVYRAPTSKTYELADLEFQVNGEGWISLDTGTPVASDFYEFDITEYVQDPDTFRPSETDGYNVIDVRRKTSAAGIDIANVSGNVTGIAVVDTNDVFGGGGPHGLSAGDQVVISGNAEFDGTYTVLEVIDVNNFTIAHAYVGIVGGGIIEVSKSVMIQTKLGVRDTIQSINYG